MSKLRIDYDPETLEALLSSDSPGHHWESIRRACEENFPEIRDVTSQTLKMPWWAFLSAREAIAYHVAANSIEIELTGRAAPILARAIEAADKVENAVSAPSLGADEVRARLRSGGFRRELKPFQLENVRHLGRLDVGATFSVPGAGKTTEALAFFTLRRKPDSILFVVAPKNAFAAWEEQLALCLPEGLKFERLAGGRAGVEALLETRPRFMLATYHLFPNIDDIIEKYLAEKDSFVFLDESHKIKGGSSKVIAASILKMSTVARGRLIMTGTPLPNSVADLIPQLSFIDPATKADDETVSNLIRPLYVRTTKKQLNLPDLVRVPCIVPLAPAQRQLYELMRSEAARQAENLLSIRSRMAFRRIGRSALSLIQFVSNPTLFSKKPFAHELLLGAVIDEGDSPKLAYACTRARRLARQRRKVIIWSSFIENVELIAERLADLGADFIHGGVEASSEADANSRETKIRRFHDDKNAMVLVANPAACSEGISLHTVCRNSIYVDRNFNAAQYIQSEDRIHRIGSDQIVTEEILVSPDTIDESVAARLEFKVNAMAEALNDESLRVDPISFDLDEADPEEGDIDDILRHLKAGLVSA